MYHACVVHIKMAVHVFIHYCKRELNILACVFFNYGIIISDSERNLVIFLYSVIGLMNLKI